MSYILDTNAVSDAGKRVPNPGLSAWLAAQAWDELWISTLTVGELRFGAVILPQGARREVLEAWIARTLLAFADRTIQIDSRVAEAWANVTARHRAKRLTISPTDELIAATGIVHGLVVVTRNARHFEHSGCRLLSPWT